MATRAASPATADSGAVGLVMGAGAAPDGERALSSRLWRAPARGARGSIALTQTCSQAQGKIGMKKAQAVQGPWGWERGRACHRHPHVRAAATAGCRRPCIGRHAAGGARAGENGLQRLQLTKRPGWGNGPVLLPQNESRPTRHARHRCAEAQHRGVHADGAGASGLAAICWFVCLLPVQKRAAGRRVGGTPIPCERTSSDAKPLSAAQRGRPPVSRISAVEHDTRSPIYNIA